MRRFFENYYLVFSYLLSQLLIMKEIPAWVSLITVCVVSYRLYLERVAGKPLPRWIPGLLSAFFTLTVFVLYRSLLDLEAAVVFLSGMSAFKILEYQNENDHRFLVLANFFLVPITLLMNFEIWYFPVVVLSFFLLWCAVVFPTAFESQRRRFLFIAGFCAVSLPLAMILFLVFPRLDGSYWGWGRWRPQTQTGFSGQHRPSDVAEMEISNRTAFRVEFEGKPNIDELYFRGDVSGFPVGIDWSRGENLPDDFVESYGKTVQNRYFFDLQGYEWIFTRDYPIKLLGDTPMYLDKLGNARLKRFAKGAVQYTVKSAKVVRRGTNNPDFYLQLPKLSEPFYELARGLQKSDLSRAQQVQKIFEYFADNQFIYSLRPGKMALIEDFLFVGKKGFCDHYSSATALILRALRIPSRLVLGYHGGEWVKLGGYLRVADKDAHSWVEYLDEEGYWQRADPLDGAVQIRLEDGSGALPSAMARTRSGSENRSGDWATFKDYLVNFGDWLNFRWTLFWLEFDFEKQKELLANNLEAIKFLFFTLVLILLLAQSRKFFKFKNDAKLPRRNLQIRKQYLDYRQRLEVVLAGCGQGLTPASTNSEVIEAIPLMKRGVLENALQFFTIYEGFEYGDRVLSKDQTAQLKRLCKELGNEVPHYYRRRFFLPPPFSRK